tara:strand:+ start:452 stop:694 length:243 start_codon:yes stop_codon:yes gene_type:complete
LEIKKTKTEIMISRHYIERENAILKQLLENGFFEMDYSSTDCDGVYVEKVYKYTSLEEFETHEKDTAEWADGAFNFTLKK